MSFIKSLLASSAILSAVAAHPGHAHSKRQEPYGSVITSCTVANTVALTFDDGPYIYTETLLNKLEAVGFRATFFQNGKNWDTIYNYNSTLKRMITGGHQIASHTWSHADLGSLSNAGVQAEMTQLETAYLNILGYFPYYMRPPFLSTGDAAIAALTTLKYVVIEVDIDTQDWQNTKASLEPYSFANYTAGFNAGGRLSLSHDPYDTTVNGYIPELLDWLVQKGLKSVPVGECLGDPQANWYRKTRSDTYNPYIAASASASASSSKVSSSASSSKASSSASSSKASVSASASSSSSKAPSVSSTSASGSKASSVASAPSSAASSKASSVSSTSASGSKASSVASAPSSAASSKASSAFSASVSGSKASSVASAPSSVASSKASSAFPASASGSKVSSMASAPSSAASSKASSAAGSSKASSKVASASAVSSSAATPSGKVDPEGTCGGSEGYVCPTGQCCSEYGWCGASSKFCGAGCQSQFGLCSKGSSGSTGSTTPSPDYTCGGMSGYTCGDSMCCSQYGWCGTGSAYCKNCQAGFGKC